MPIHVHKFGGTSVGGPDRLRGAAAILKAAAATGETTIAVSSAMSGVTNDLVAIADDAAGARLDPALARARALRDRHHETATALGAPAETDPLHDEIAALCDELESIVRAAVHLSELTPRAADRLVITGEKLAVRLLARALEETGVPAQALDADTFLDTDDNFGAAEPVRDVADRESAAAIRRIIGEGRIPVITGFCGRAPDGATTTLGRGGSDLSATLVAAAMRADRCTIWTDVPGVFSADPRIVESPRLLARLHYREAAEMSYYGAKVLHPRTISPVARLRIPVLVRSSLEPDAPGTIIDATFTPESEMVKAVTAIKAQCLVSIEGNGMTGVPGVAARAFGALAAHDVSATMISQASSEASICLAIPQAAAATAERTLKQAFQNELSHGLIEEISVREGVGLVAAVGIGMAQHTGVAGRVFSALGEAGVNVLAIAQGSSELNISFAVDEAQVADAVRAVHERFIESAGRDVATAAGEGADAPAAPPPTRPLVLLGCGTVGRALLDVARDLPHLRVTTVADRSGLLHDADRLSSERILTMLAEKDRGRPLADQPGATNFAEAGAGEALAALEFDDALRPILIDATDADGHDALFVEALAAGFDVVTANKKPLAQDAERERVLRDAIEQSGRTLRAEATVGAGLPVLSTIESLLETGDTIRTIEACLSGTLGYLISRVESGLALSAAVADAIARGFTEPDPTADLAGDDVARKAVILARASGLASEGRAVRLALEPFLDGLASDLPRAELLEEIASRDRAFARRAKAARKARAALRYVATITRDGARVTLTEVPLDHPLAALRGPDNMIVLTTDRYPAENPLVIRGPGAGAAVTAAALLADVCRLLDSCRLPCRP